MMQEESRKFKTTIVILVFIFFGIPAIHFIINVIIYVNNFGKI